MRRFFRKVYLKLIGKSHMISSDAYIRYLKRKGVKVGEGTVILNTKHINIDITRPELIEIGSNVFLHKNTTIRTHDWASWTFVNKYCEFIPSHGKVKIGNNVWLGENVTILKNVEIGNNVIIGANSLVTKSIPSESVAVGSPARVISSLDEYYNKRKREYETEAIKYAIAIIESGRMPTVEDFKDDYPIFTDGRNYSDYNFPYEKIFSPDQFEIWKTEHHAKYNGFDEFIEAVNSTLKSK